MSRNSSGVILIAAEQDNGKPTPATLELIGEGRRLADLRSTELYALCLGSGLECCAAELTRYPVDRAYACDGEELTHYRADAYARIWERLIRELEPVAVLFSGSRLGKSLAPVLAARFDSGLTADCTALSFDPDGRLLQSRPAYSGDIMAEIVTTGDRPYFATVLEQAFRPAPRGKERLEKIIRLPLGSFGSRITIVEANEIPKKKGIAEASVIVAAGQGFKSREDLEPVRELAALLGGETASSRTLVEKGWVEPERQIGLSGKIVRPDLIITCGISGSAQFMAGMRNSRYIIAVNSDRSAPIFTIAHQPLLGDIYEILPRLIGKIKSKPR